MWKNGFVVFITLSMLMTACIGDDFIDDFVEPEVRVVNAIDTIEVGTEYQLEVTFFNNVGREDDMAPVTWSSDHSDIISVSRDGLATAIAVGRATLTASISTADAEYSESIVITVGQSTSVQLMSRPGKIVTTSSYVLEGDFVLEKTDGGLRLDVAENYRATSALPGLYVYLSNNPNSIADAYEISEVDVFSGAHHFDIAEDFGLTDFSHVIYYCKPFNVKVGEGQFD